MVFKFLFLIFIMFEIIIKFVNVKKDVINKLMDNGVNIFVVISLIVSLFLFC